MSPSSRTFAAYRKPDGQLIDIEVGEGSAGKGEHAIDFQQADGSIVQVVRVEQSTHDTCQTYPPKSWSRRLSNTGRDYRIVDMPPALKAKLVELAEIQRCPLREIVIAALTVYAYQKELKR